MVKKGKYGKFESVKQNVLLAALVMLMVFTLAGCPLDTDSSGDDESTTLASTNDGTTGEDTREDDGTGNNGENGNSGISNTNNDEDDLGGSTSPGGTDGPINSGTPEPVTITFTGHQTILPDGTDMTVNVQVSSEEVNLQWTLNGEILEGETGKTITIGSDLAAGDYTLTCIASDSDGNQLGSGSIDFEVHESTGFLNGTIKDAVSSDPIEGVQVDVYHNGQLVNSVISDEQGNYTISLPYDSGYEVHYEKEEYISAEYSNISVEEDQTNYLQAVMQIQDIYSGQGNITGIIKNALTGQAVEGADIVLRAGINVTSGDEAASAATDSSGNYLFSGLEAGHYTAEVSLNNFNTAYFTVIVVGGKTTSGQNTSISPTPLSGEIRIVLTWGENPTDLDSHLKIDQAENSGVNHIYYGTMGDQNSAPYALLDVDDVNSYGPETITIYQQDLEDTYSYYVHNYSHRNSPDSSSLGSSGAVVKVYTDQGLIAEYNVPGQPGTLWKVFTLTGGIITPANEMFNESSPRNVVNFSFFGAGLASDDLELVKFLPEK